MTVNDLKDFDLKLGTRKKLITKIDELKKNFNPNSENELKFVISKLEKLKGFGDLSKSEKIDKARHITFKKDLMNTYLNENFIQTIKTVIERNFNF